MARLELNLLGPFSALIDGKSITTFESSKVRALLAYLAAEAKRSHPRDRLAGLLWPDWPQKAALQNLSYALSDLRKNILDREATPAFLLISREALQINPASDCWVDVGEFEKHSAVSFPPSTLDSRLSTLDPQQSTIINLKSAIELYRGEFLEGFSLADSPAFEEWILTKREYYHQKAMEALHDLAEAYGQRGEYKPALTYARRQLELEPWREGAHRQMMRLLGLNGQRSAALAQYEACQRLLAKELGAKPSAETTRLYEAIRDENIEGIRERQGIGSRGIGANPIPYPLSPTILPPEPSESPSQDLFMPPRPKHNLPLQLTSFIGRQKEIAEVQAMLRKTPGRLVTLTGSGGVGKTRLALQAATGLLDSFSDGAWLVELASLSDPERVPSAAATALDVHESASRPAVVSVRDYLRLKNLLLVLDNCEHLASACAGLVVTLLQACPRLHILATSRERLGVEGETTFHVPSLSTPSTDQRLDREAMSQYEAVRLFVERVQSASPGFTLTEENAQAVVQICQRLDGIPLAIELAAARTHLLSVGQIAARLDDAFRLLTGGSRTALPRHQTLRASIDWSYNLLTPQEQRLLRTLSIFAGGWTLEAAEAVCTDQNVLDGLGQLVDKSLIYPVSEAGGINRYRMLDTIQQYAGEKLAGEDRLARDRHLAYFLQMVERLEPEMHGRHQKAHLDQLEEELDNLRLALGWALQTDLEAELRLGSALMWFWLIHTRYLEGLEWLEQGLARLQTQSHPEAPPIRPALRAKVLTACGCMHQMEGMRPPAISELEESLGIYRGMGLEGKAGAALALRWLGATLCFQGDYSRGIPLLREALVLSREVKDPFGIGEGLFALGYQLIGRDPGHQEARSLLQESLALLLEIGDPDGIATAYRFLGQLAYHDHELEQAKSMWEQSLSYHQQSGNRLWISEVLYFQGVVAHVQKDFPAANEYLQRLVAIQRDIGNPRTLGWSLINMGVFSLTEGNYEIAGQFLEEALLLWQTVGDQAGIVDTHLHLSKLAWVEGNTELANRELAKALAAHKELNDSYLAANIQTFQGTLAWASGDEKKAEACLIEALKTAGQIKWEEGVAHALDVLAQMKTHGQSEHAARMFGAAEHLNRDYPIFLTPVERARREAALAELKDALGEARMAELWAEGQSMSVEAAIAYALEEVGDPLER